MANLRGLTFFVDPPNSSENVSQTSAKDQIVFTDPPKFHCFHALLSGQPWGHLVIFHKTPYWSDKLFVHPLHTSDNFIDPTTFDPSPLPRIINVKSLIAIMIEMNI